MGDKSTLTHYSIAVLIACSANFALADCNVKSNIVTNATLDNFDIKNKTDFEFITVNPGKKVCRATIRTSFDGTPITITEQAIMQSGVHILETCKLAEAQAIEHLIKRVGEVSVTARSEMNCDETENTMFSPKVGNIGKLTQFKKDGKYNRTFVHQGSECIWFNDVEWTGELHQANGIACKLTDDNYVVVDKF